MKKKMLSILILSLLILTFGVSNVRAEGIAPSTIVDSVFSEPISSNWIDQSNIYRVESVLYWLETESNYSSYGKYYVCEIHDDQRLQTCYFFDDYTKLKYDSNYQRFYTERPTNLVRMYSAWSSNEYPSISSSEIWNYDQYFSELPSTTHYRYVTNLKQYLKTGQILSPDMNGYERNYWKYNLDYQDFIISIYDENRPSDVDTYPLDIFLLGEHFEDTRITIYNVLSNQFVAEFTEYNLDYEDDERFYGFSHELKEGEVFRIITTSEEARDYYITNMYTQSQILISEVVDGNAEYLNSEGVSTTVSGIITPPPRGTIVSVVEYQEYGDMNSLFKKTNSFISDISSKSFIIFKPIGDLFNMLNPTLRSAIISLFVLYLVGVCVVLLRRG